MAFIFLLGGLRLANTTVPFGGNMFFANFNNNNYFFDRYAHEALSNAQIAERLFLADGTVRNHISLILEKTNLEHRTQIAVKYFERTI